MEALPVGRSLDEVDKVFAEIPAVVRNAVDVSDMTAIAPFPKFSRVAVQPVQGFDPFEGRPVPVGRLGPILSFGAAPLLPAIQDEGTRQDLLHLTEPRLADEPKCFPAGHSPNRLLSFHSLSDGFCSTLPSDAKAGGASSPTRQGLGCEGGDV